MDAQDDAYKVLGVNKTATDAEIKKAYRKLALQHHPDRQQTKEDRERAHHLFTKISNAYEILSDPRKKQEYDASKHRQPRQGSSAATGDDPFFGRHHPHSAAHFDDLFSGFHDPFELFERVFQREFGASATGHQRMGGRRSSPFDDPFFSSPSPFFGGGMGGGMGVFGGGCSVFDDPFFSGQPAGLGGMNQMMMMNSMGGMGGNGLLGGGANFSSTTVSSSFGGGNGMSSVSTSTSTRIVNGRREVITERVVRHPDGRVERHVESSGGESRALPGPEQDSRRRRRSANERSGGSQPSARLLEGSDAGIATTGGSSRSLNRTHKKAKRASNPHSHQFW